MHASWGREGRGNGRLVTDAWSGVCGVSVVGGARWWDLTCRALGGSAVEQMLGGWVGGAGGRCVIKELF